MLSILCNVHKESDAKKAQKELEECGLQDIYILENPSSNAIQIGGQIRSLPKFLRFSSMNLLPAEIDWNKQSQLHSKYYKDGLIEVNLSDFCSIDAKFCMTPGPSFGDLSHETTQLMLENMRPYVEDRLVIDIGSGNGILSLASYFMNAKKVIGIEIDNHALSHSIENRNLNKISDKKILFCSSLPEEITSNKEPLVILMNMTFEEQKQVFYDYQELFTKKNTLIASGIIKSQTIDYERFIENYSIVSKLKFHKKQWTLIIN